LTLRDALGLVLAAHPDLKSASREVAALKAETLQAGLLPNPELEIEVEDVFGGKENVDGAIEDFSGTDAAESTLAISQLVELGGKRAKRRRVAESDSNLAAWDYEARRLELIGKTHSAFVDALAAQELAILSGQLAEVAQKSARAVTLRVDAGKVSPLEIERSQLELESLRAGQQQADRLRQAACEQLAAMWGGSGVTFSRLAGNLETLSAPPSLESLRERLEQNPDLARRAEELTQRQAVLELERSQAWPDLTLAAGARHFNESDNYSFLAGVSIPLRLFDRNQGAIRAAEERLAKAAYESEGIRRQLMARLSGVFGELSASYSKSLLLRDKALPRSETIYERSLEGYNLGKFGLLEVLDAQRAVFELRAEYLESLVSYHKAAAELESLIGEPLETVSTDFSPAVRSKENSND
jgi:cobalt-zinc-cadmium efflux system outer membrane protein